MAGWKSENEKLLNYIFMKIYGQFLNAISSVQLLAANYKQVVFSLILL